MVSKPHPVVRPLDQNEVQYQGQGLEATVVAVIRFVMAIGTVAGGRWPKRAK